MRRAKRNQAIPAVAGEIGSIFKKGSTISAAMGGCRRNWSFIHGRRCLCEVMVVPAQVLMAAEIAMEHTTFTCDPIEV
jgi:L-serine dehydratase